MKPTYIIATGRLQEWHHALSKEVSIKGDGIDIVKKDIEAIMRELQKESEVKKDLDDRLKFADIKVDETYVIKPQVHTKTFLHNVPVTVVKKNRTKVVVVLNRVAGNYSVGTRFSISPEALMLP